MSWFSAIPGPFRGKIWRPRPGDTGMDLDGGERITRFKTGIDFFPWPTVNLNPVSGILPMMDVATLARAFARDPYGPGTTPITNPGTVAFYDLPKDSR